MHQVDKPTLEYARKLYPNIVGWFPLLHSKNGKPYFNTTRFALSTGEHVSVFAVKPVYYEALGGFWRPLSEICEHHGNRKIILNNKWRKATPRFIDWLSKRQKLLGSELLLPTPFGDFTSNYHDLVRPSLSVGLTVTIAYPQSGDPGPEDTTVDGRARYNSTAQVWSGIIAGNGTDASDNTSSDVAWIISGGLNTGASSNFDILWRSFILFNTEPIPNDDTITEASIGIYIASTPVNEFSVAPTMTIMGATTASNTAIAASDFQGTFSNQTSFATAQSFGEFTSGQYKIFNLNSSGISNISKTGVSKFGLRCAEDITGGTTPQQAVGAREFNVSGAASETADTDRDPKLVVVHNGAPTSCVAWPVRA